MSLRFAVKQFVKIGIQNVFLPIVYRYFSARYVSADPQKIIFADAHHEEIPYSMKALYRRLKNTDCQIIEDFHDYSKMSAGKLIGCMIRFMKLYANAGYVVICDNFLPVASCRKRPDTKVIQLWHGGGAYKKFGYDTEDDIPAYYRGNVFKNYDLITVSAPICISFFESAMRAEPNTVHATGISRTDLFFDKEYLKEAEKRFYAVYPDARGKKVLLWAPTFRGDPGAPVSAGEEEIAALERRLGEEWKIIIRHHPHMKMETEQTELIHDTEDILPFTDHLVTDYSSVLFDYLLFERPFTIFAPDLDEYLKKRGFYVEPFRFSGRVARNLKELEKSILQAGTKEREQAELSEWKRLYMGMCDGKATDRILAQVELKAEERPAVKI